MLARWWSTLHAPVGVELLGQQTWNQKASVLPVPQFLPPALIFRPEGRLTANNNSVCSVWAADRNTAHLKQFFRFMPTFLHRLHQIWSVRVRRVIGSVWILWFFLHYWKHQSVILLTMSSTYTTWPAAAGGGLDISLSPKTTFLLGRLRILFQDQSKTTLVSAPQSPGPVLILILSGPGLYSVWPCLSLGLVSATESLFPPSCYNGGVFLWLEVLGTDDKVHRTNQEASQPSKQLIHICGVFRGADF